MRGDCISDNEGINARDAEERKMITGHTYPFDSVDDTNRRRYARDLKWDTLSVSQATAKGPDTYLHAGAAIGWPADHKAEDTFEVPPLIKPRSVDVETFDPVADNGHEPVKSNAAIEGAAWPDFPNALTADQGADAFLKNLQETSSVSHEYAVGMTDARGADLVLVTISTYRSSRPIASFASEADARTAAEALNNHKGY